MEHAEDRMDAMHLFPNPENPLEIKISLFEGPLDLLLHLIRKKEVSIAEVKLSELTSSYLSYIELMQSVNLDIAGEFLEIAATLILIKSRHLLPTPFLVLCEILKIQYDLQLLMAFFHMRNLKTSLTWFIIAKLFDSNSFWMKRVWQSGSSDSEHRLSPNLMSGSWTPSVPVSC